MIARTKGDAMRVDAAKLGGDDWANGWKCGSAPTPPTAQPNYTAPFLTTRGPSAVITFMPPILLPKNL